MENKEGIKRRTLEDQGIKTPEVKVAKPRPKRTRFTMVKNYVGAMAVTLESEDFSTPARLILFKFNQDEKQIPAKWAIGALVSDGALGQMEKGYFTFKEFDEYVAMAEDMGHYVPDSIKQPEITLKEMRKALKSNNVQDIKGFLPKLSTKQKTDLITLGQTLYQRLNMEVVTLIEKELGISLKTINLDE